ncbi:MAG TPA: hypothetical protein PLP83_00665 [Candidatus Aminicenantes bacterium]|nr:hypothetical protein [Candidatus Aminicenantes bacterium]
MSEKTIAEGVAGVVRTYELMDRVRTRQDLVIRDDQFGHEALLDAAAYARRRRIPLSVLDTGRFGLVEVEALARAGARVLTSDEARPRADEWEVLLAACRKGGARLSVFWAGPLPGAEAASGPSFQDLEDLLGAGLDFHISDRTHPRDAAALASLAAAAKKGRAYFVLYHVGPPADGLAGTAGRGAWIHFGDEGLAEEPAAERAVAIAAAASRAGSRAVVRVERGLPLELLEALWAAGAAFVFLTPPSDDGSGIRLFERKALRRKLPPRAYHLSTVFLP